MKKRFKTAFTMAELLISLTIIGVVASIMLPSLSNNVNDRTLSTRRIAMFSRLSQAMGLIDSISDVGKRDASGNIISNWEDTAAMTFVIDKLSQGIKYENTCEYGAFKSCGFSGLLSREDGSTFTMPATFKALVNNNDLNAPETKPVAFVTKNGESIALYYNPDCMAKTGSSDTYMNFVCVNMIYDLNGTKSPNTLGKDVGVATVLYSSSPDFVMPVPTGVNGTVSTNSGETEAETTCSDNGYLLPNLEEMISLSVNNKLLNGTSSSNSWSGLYATSSKKAIVDNDGTTVYYWGVKTDGDAMGINKGAKSAKYVCVRKLSE